MVNFKSNLFLIFILLILFYHCGLTEKSIDKEIKVKVDKGYLNVHLKGNPEKPLLVNLHSGLGGSSAFEIYLLDSGLKENHLVAYLDQRGCGKSSKCTDSTMLTLNQLVKDLDVVIDTLRSRFDRKKVNLMGSSWGGTYGLLYLLENQSKINAFTAIGATANRQYKYDFLIAHEMDTVIALVESNISGKRKEELLLVLSELERIEELDISDYPMEEYLLTQNFPAKIGFNAFYANPDKKLPIGDIIKDETQMAKTGYTLEEFYSAINKGETVKKTIQKLPGYYAMNLEEDLATIEVPVQIIQGAEDYIIGPEQGQKIYNALVNVNEADKELHILPNVGHSPAIEAPEKLMTLVNEFFEKYEIE